MLKYDMLCRATTKSLIRELITVAVAESKERICD